MERRRPIGKGLVEEPDIAQGGDREAVALALYHACGQTFQVLLATLGAAFAHLDGFHGFPADGPAGQDDRTAQGIGEVLQHGYWKAARRLGE